MEIIRHLSDEQLKQLLLESDQQVLQPLLETLPEAARAAAVRDERFWSRQREAIRSRIARLEGRRTRMFPVLAWATIAAVIALGAVLLSRQPRPIESQATVQEQAPNRAHGSSAVDPDQQLLLAVEEAMQSGGPAALEPAALLAEEIELHRQSGSHSKARSKETRHEE